MAVWKMAETHNEEAAGQLNNCSAVLLTKYINTIIHSSDRLTVQLC